MDNEGGNFDVDISSQCLPHRKVTYTQLSVVSIATAYMYVFVLVCNLLYTAKQYLTIIF